MAKRKQRQAVTPYFNKSAMAALATIDWRLNFYDDNKCALVSKRGARLPSVVRKLGLNVGERVTVTFGRERGCVDQFKLRRGVDFIELFCAHTPVLLWLVTYGKFKIRCNYQLEALEQMLLTPLKRYLDIAIISDGKWNKLSAPIFKYARGDEPRKAQQ